MGRLFFREAFLFLAVLGLVLTTPLRGAWPRFSPDELEVLYLLWLLFAATKALEREGVFEALARRLEAGKALVPKLVLGTFLLAALVTNDAALFAAMPLVLALRQKRVELAALVIVATNAGSTLTPFGNPQNLYLYWYYNLSPTAFFAAMLPLAGGFFLALAATALFLSPPPLAPPEEGRVSTSLPVLAALFGVILVILRVLPLWTSVLALFLLALWDRKAFRVDYGLLLTFAAFFLLVDNLETLLPARFAHPHAVFALSMGLSQVLSNVPAAIFLAPLTPSWKALLWGANVGGFGTPVASMANLIALRLFLKDVGGTDRRRFLVLYALTQAAALVLGLGLYALFHA